MAFQHQIKGKGLAGLDIAVDDADGSTFGGKQARGGGADAGGPARDDGNLAL